MTLVGTPRRPGLGTPVFAQSCNLCEVLGSMIKGEYVMDLRGRQPSVLHHTSKGTRFYIHGAPAAIKRTWASWMMESHCKEVGKRAGLNAEMAY